MASSSKPGLPPGSHHEQKLPARTPGSLGVNDHGDPNVEAHVGDTPGPLGVNDVGDPDKHTILDWMRSAACGLGIISLCPAKANASNSKQKLLNAQDDARANPAFQPRATATYCNQATLAIAKQFGAPIGPLNDAKGNAVNANAQAENLAKSTQYREVTPEEAQKIANNGGLVIVAFVNPNGHGHTATVRPEGVSGDSPPKGGKGPLLNDIGLFDKVQNSNYAFKKGTEVHYYTPTDK
jgi:hypothetical protein